MCSGFGGEEEHNLLLLEIEPRGSSKFLKFNIVNTVYVLIYSDMYW
jgi:hypothetical protein